MSKRLPILPHAPRVGKLFRLPLVEHFVEIGTEFSPPLRCTPMEIDGFGVAVYHSRGNTPSVRFARGYLIGSRQTYCLISAQTLLAAIKTFFAEWSGATLGTRSRALELHTGSAHTYPFEEYPVCELMHRSPLNGQLLCGQAVEDGVNGEFGGCVLEHYDPPGFFCPVEDYRRKSHVA